MRRPRPDIPWSAGRVIRRAAYEQWISSPGWYRRREAWAAAHAAAGLPLVCAVCDQPWTPRHGDLHHRSYDRLGHEADTDLVPLCRSCHEAVHQAWDTWPGWRRLGRATATDMIIAALRAAKEGENAVTVPPAS